METTAEQTTNCNCTAQNVQIDYAKKPGFRFSWSHIAGFVIFGGMLLWALWCSSDGQLAVFIDIPSVVLTLGCASALLLATFGWQGAWQAIKSPLGGILTADEQRTAVSFFKLGAVFLLASGFIGTFIGLVAMLSNMDDPSKIGMGMAIALLTQLYAAVLAVGFYAIATLISRKERTSETLGTVARQALPMSVGTAVAGTLTCLLACFILLVSMANFDEACY